MYSFLIKESWIKFIILLVIYFIFQSCGTIWGGRKYTAQFAVNYHPEAKIYYNGECIGQGTATIKIPRVNADKIEIKISEDGCETQSIFFDTKKARGWALFFSCFVININNVTIPFTGAIIDVSTGAAWKPDISKPNIKKINYDKFKYYLDYKGCDCDFMNKISIQKLILNDTVLIQKMYIDDRKEFDIYLDNNPLSKIISKDSLMSYFLSNSDSIVFNPVVDTSYNNYYTRISKYKYKNIKIAKYTYKNNQLKSIGLKIKHYKNINPDYFYEAGTWKYYYPNGVLKEIVNYNLGGKRNGLNIKYKEDGKILSISKYLNDKLIK